MSYNCKVVDFPKGQHVTIYRRPIQEKQSISKYFKKTYHNENRTERAEQHSNEVSLNRAKNKIYNIARSNDWDYFITLTFDRQKVNSDNYVEVTQKITMFCNHMQQRICPNMKYLIVPELHADGEHYHFHGLLANVQGMKFIDSGKRTEKNQTIFNMPQWIYGFTTATRVSDTQKVSAYITKYITKDLDKKLKNKKRYFRNRNTLYTEGKKTNVEFDEFIEVYNEAILTMKTIDIPKAKQSVTYVELDM